MMTDWRTSQDVTNQHYLIQCLFSGSPTEKMNINEKLDNSFFVWTRQRRFYPYWNLLPVLEIDLSSVWPHFEIKSETSLMEETVDISEEDVVAEMLEHDFIVRMSPRKRYAIEMKVENIRRGEPRIVEPEEF